MSGVEQEQRPATVSTAPERPSRWQFPGLSRPGIAVGLLFFGLSLLPSLLPRTWHFQGAVSGITVMIGYLIGVAGAWGWRFLGLPAARGRLGKAMTGVAVGVPVIVTVLGVWQHVGWQNDVRAIFDMAPITPFALIPVAVLTVLVAALLLGLARLLRRLFDLVSGLLARWLPRRVALLLGGLAVLMVVNFVSTGVLVTGFFDVSNRVFSTSDRSGPDGALRPDSPLRSGSPASAAAWSSLGRQGRAFVSNGPTVAELDAYHGGGAVEPIRVYAGLRSADTLQGRADLVVEELIRTGAFDREVLVVGMTTGTGFLDPWGVDPLEYVVNGDSAIVGVQYSYLPSWISLLADREEAGRTARVVFETIHRHWSAEPEAARPELYLYGLSLGSFGVESILTSIDVVNEPIDGALLVGPPFMNELWNDVVAGRQAGTPPWLPVYRDGRTVRFTGERDALAGSEGEWGPTRIAYLQHATDPVVFFSPDLLTTAPDWLEEGQRSPDLSEDFVWVPFVTMWQVAFDLAGASEVPVGWGHLYSPQANARAWIAVTRPDGWTDADTRQLTEHLGERLRAEQAEAEG